MNVNVEKILIKQFSFHYETSKRIWKKICNDSSHLMEVFTRLKTRLTRIKLTCQKYI